MSDIRNEQQRVNEIIEEIDRKTANYIGKTKSVGSQVQQIKQEFWDDVTVNLDEPDDVIETFTSIKQQAELLSERERSKGLIDKQLNTLAKLKNSPYFGRIDFHEKGENQSDKIYIGIASLMDSDDENFLIYDWRAPISSLYYDYSPGHAQYETPYGEIKGDITLKRQFIIKNGLINGLFDTGLTIGDQLLQEVLGNQANSQMKSIVATIQKEQNAIIRNTKDKIVVVQGVAGSGKTSAALQRAAFLLYRFRNTLHSDNIILFSPNPLFNSYVATVLPELGEDNMEQTTFQQYLNSRLAGIFIIEDPFDQMEYLLTAEDQEKLAIRKKNIQYKSSLAYKKEIDDYLGYLLNDGLVFTDIVFRGEAIINKESIKSYFYSLEPTIPIPNRMQLLQEWLLIEIRKREKNERRKPWVENAIEFLDKDDYLEAYKDMQKRNNEVSFDDYEIEKKYLTKMIVSKKFKPIKSKIKKMKFIDMKMIFIQLFSHIKNKDYELLADYTVKNIQQNHLSYEDATPYLYLQDQIEGKKSNTSIRHIFVDEAQDYSPFQFAFMQELYPYSKWTLLGDLNQSIYFHSLSKSSLYEVAVGKTYRLMRSYRSTKEIVEFTKSLIADGEDIQPFNRKGEKPLLIQCSSNVFYQEMLNKIDECKRAGDETIAVICKTASESEQVYKQLMPDLHNVKLIDKQTLSYEKGVLVIPSYLAKGIEFDAVFIHNAAEYQLEYERKLFYTACTRAMHTLILFSTEDGNPFIKEADETSYRKILR